MLSSDQVKEVQAKREQRFFENRHRGALAKEKASIKAEIKDNIELLAPAAATDREKTLTAISDKAKQVPDLLTSRFFSVSVFLFVMRADPNCFTNFPTPFGIAGANVRFVYPRCCHSSFFARVPFCWYSPLRDII